MTSSRFFDYLLVFLAGAAATFVFTPIAMRWARRIGAVVYPDEHRVHEKPTPTLGGAAIFYGLLAALLVAALRPGLRSVLTSSSEIWGVLLGAVAIFGTGAIDDLRDVSPPAKMAGQVLAGSLLSLFGVTMLYFRLWPTDHFVSLGRGGGDLSPLITVIWVVGMANAINFIDGLDGLAAGIVGIASVSIFIFVAGFSSSGIISETSIGPLVMAATAGICAGFLPWNFFPARVFMGDGGALLLGFLMAAGTIVIGGRTPDLLPGKTFFFFGPILIPLVILGIPLIDTFFSIIRRARGRKSPATRDLEHLHYRLVRLGHGHRRAVLILYAWSILLSAIVLIPALTGKGNFIVIILVFAAALALFTFFAGSTEDNGELSSPPAGLAVENSRSARPSRQKPGHTGKPNGEKKPKQVLGPAPEDLKPRAPN